MEKNSVQLSTFRTAGSVFPGSNRIHGTHPGCADAPRPPLSARVTLRHPSAQRAKEPLPLGAWERETIKWAFARLIGEEDNNEGTM